MQSYYSEVEYARVHILYKLDGKERAYIPDFLVRLKNGAFVVVEVKPPNQQKTPMNLAKFEVATTFCKRLGWRFEIWDHKELHSFLN